jgi:hypothetical protein
MRGQGTNVATTFFRAPSRRVSTAIVVLATVASVGCSKVSELFGSDSSAKVSKTVSDGATAVQQAAASVTTQLGLATPVNAAPAKGRGEAAGTPGKQAAPGKRAQAAAPPIAQAQPTISSSAIAEAAATVSVPVAPAPEPRPAEVRAESPEPLAAPAKTLNPVDGPIYSQDDPDVTPARLLTTREGGPLFRGMVPDMNTMEMVVSEQGRVEQVRLLTPAKRMTDVLLLSGAKTWKFAPASRDGQPVRYRTMFSWPSVP